MIQLGVNIDHIATIRQARKTYEPDPVHAVALAEQGGADGITVHLREDRRHIQDRDVYLLREIVRGKLNLEMASAKEIVSLAMEVGPDQITLVPEKRQEITTEGGLDCLNQQNALAGVIAQLHTKQIEVSIFIDPDMRQIEAAKEIGADRIEFHTGKYANDYYAARGRTKATTSIWKKEKEKLFVAAHKATKLGLYVSAGHGLNYFNISELLDMPGLSEVNIGHSIIARSVFTGLERAVSDMKQLLKK